MLKIIPIERIVSKGNIRNEKDDSIMELVDSIREHGLIEPLAVKEADHNGNYELIAGHRRFEALKIINEPFIECNIMENVDKEEKLILQLAENTHRKEMSAYEICAVLDQYKARGMTEKQIAIYLNKPYNWVHNNYQARAILEHEYQSGIIPEEQKKLSAGVIRAAHRRKQQGNSKLRYYNGFSVTQKGHSYILSFQSFDTEQDFHNFCEGYKREE